MLETYKQTVVKTEECNWQPKSVIATTILRSSTVQYIETILHFTNILEMKKKKMSTPFMQRCATHAC